MGNTNQRWLRCAYFPVDGSPNGSAKEDYREVRFNAAKTADGIIIANYFTESAVVSESDVRAEDFMSAQVKDRPGSGYVLVTEHQRTDRVARISIEDVPASSQREFWVPAQNVFPFVIGA